jgi:hypothetical protein
MNRANRCGAWLALVFSLAMGVGVARAADHVDSPVTSALGNRDLDITDVYIFRSPANPNNVVIAVNHQSIFNPNGGIALPTAPSLFANDGLYQTFIDRNGDLVPDLTITTRFSGVGAAQQYTVTGLTAVPITGTVTQLGAPPIVVTTPEGISAFAGARDDPFFFDLNAFNDFLFSGPYVPAAGLRRPGSGAPQNFFRVNVAAIVLEIPVPLVTGGTSPTQGVVKIWSKTFRQS